MSKRICYDFNGKTCVVSPAPGLDIEYIMGKDVPRGAKNVCVIDEKELPDRAFRNAWELDGGKVKVSMPKARDIHMARIRKARDGHPEWAKIDADRNRAVESGDGVLLGKVQKAAQALRDIPDTVKPAIVKAKKPEQLEKVWPKTLPR